MLICIEGGVIKLKKTHLNIVIYYIQMRLFFLTLWERKHCSKNLAVHVVHGLVATFQAL